MSECSNESENDDNDANEQLERMRKRVRHFKPQRHFPTFPERMRGSAVARDDIAGVSVYALSLNLEVVVFGSWC
jgi:hypothetical protein